MQNKLSLIKSKILFPNSNSQSLKSRIAQWRFKNLTIAFTNGCFDILHRGHVEYLCEASDAADILLVGINDDQSVKKLNKGTDRPVNNLDSRMIVLSGFQFINGIIPFGEETPERLIEEIEPDVLIKGGDYDATATNPSQKGYIVGSTFVKSYGGIVKTIPFVHGFSTTGIIQKLSPKS